MTKAEYFILALQNNLYRKFDNMISLFLITDYDAIKKTPYGITVKDGYYYYYDDDLNIQPFTPAAESGEPLLKYLDPISLKVGDLANVIKPTETSFGNVYVNAIIAKTSGDKIPFITGNIGKQLGDLEQKIADIMVDDPEEGEAVPAGYISVSDHTTILSDIQTLEELSSLVVVAATERNIVPPKGVKEFKAKLVKKYKDTLDDPQTQVKIIKELQAFDEDWLKDDPSNNIVLSGKLKGTARTKTFLASGHAPNFDAKTSANFRIQSFNDGAETDPKQLAIINSSIRYGSYARGSLTAVAGTIAKSFMQVFTSKTVEDRDCGTKLTRTVKVVGDRNKYIGRTYVKSGNLIPITIENVGSLMNSNIEVRTPSYCKEGENEVCRVCAGENLWNFRESLTQAGTDLANTIIYKVYFAILKSTNVTSVKIKVEDLIT